MGIETTPFYREINEGRLVKWGGIGFYRPSHVRHVCQDIIVCVNLSVSLDVYHEITGRISKRYVSWSFRGNNVSHVNNVRGWMLWQFQKSGVWARPWMWVFQFNEAFKYIRHGIKIFYKMSVPETSLSETTCKWLPTPCFNIVNL